MIKKLHGFFRDIYYKFYYDSLRKSIAYRHPFSFHSKEEMFWNALRYIRLHKVEGSYMEFGTYQGESLCWMYYLAKKLGLDINFIVFDSFEGFPESEGCFQKGDVYCSFEEFIKIIKKRGLDLKKVKIIKGWFKDTLTDEWEKKLNTKASIVMVDCDLYMSTVPVLNFITDLISNGAILMFDDWFANNADPNMGEQKAVREWLKKNPNIKLTEYMRFGLLGNSFIVRKLK